MNFEVKDIETDSLREETYLLEGVKGTKIDIKMMKAVQENEKGFAYYLFL